jgi:apolipoprotein N-acyltransferase
MYSLLQVFLLMLFMSIGFIPAMLLSVFGTTFTLVLILALYSLIYYFCRNKMNIPHTISLATSCIVMLGFMGYYGYSIAAEGPDAQAAIAFAYYGGLSFCMGVAAYFIMLITIKLMLKIISFFKKRIQ